MSAISPAQTASCSRRSPASASWSSATSCSTITSGRCHAHLAGSTGPRGETRSGNRHGRRRRQCRRQRRLVGRRGRAGRRDRQGCERRQAAHAPGEPEHPIRSRVSAGLRHHHENPGRRAEPAALPDRRRGYARPYRATFASEKRSAVCSSRSRNATRDSLRLCQGSATTELMAKITAIVRSITASSRSIPSPAGGNDSDGLDLITPNHKEALEMTGLKPDPDGLDDALICRRIWEQYHPGTWSSRSAPTACCLSHQACPARIPTAAREVFDVSAPATR